ncbi:MAG TPA: (2Fe-2S)-binding protein [Gemmatimonadaceae bacterium]|jgi:sarcosine oxidase subunit alpha|nr:(2Fe-2S)-binding protein [Gemmatimonadaceae bacterium]
MSHRFDIVVDGRPVAATGDWTLAAALLNAGIVRFRTSVTGEARAPLCGMGSCFECRVRVNGVAHQRACLLLCEEGMIVETET